MAQRQARGQRFSHWNIQRAFGQMLVVAARLGARAARPAAQFRTVGADVDGSGRAAAAKERALRAFENLHLLHIQHAQPRMAHAGGNAVHVHYHRAVIHARLEKRADAAYAHIGASRVAPGIDLHARRAAQHVFQAAQAPLFQRRIVDDIDGKGQILGLFFLTPRLHRHGGQRGRFGGGRGLAPFASGGLGSLRRHGCAGQAGRQRQPAWRHRVVTAEIESK